MRGDWDKFRKVNSEAGGGGAGRGSCFCLFGVFSPLFSLVLLCIHYSTGQPDSQVTCEHLPPRLNWGEKGRRRMLGRVLGVCLWLSCKSVQLLGSVMVCLSFVVFAFF